MRNLILLVGAAMIGTTALAQQGFGVPVLPPNPVVVQVQPPTVYQFPSGSTTVVTNNGSTYVVQPDGAHRACPPGLAKKNNGCLPPGQAKKQHANNVAVMGASGETVYVTKPHKVHKNKGHKGGKGGKHHNK